MIDRRIGLALGAAVLGGVLAMSWWLYHGAGRRPAAPPAATRAGQADGGVIAAPLPSPAVDPGSPTQPVLAMQGLSSVRPRVAGTVEYPGGRPAAGATVTLYRQVSAWSEWRREVIDTAITGANGRFEFATVREPNLLVGFGHTDFAGGLLEAPPSLPELTLRLQRGFDVEGVVTNDAGLPMTNVRVALESTLADERIVRTTDTNSSGRFRFSNVAMGTMRVVARHDVWQPAVLSNVVVGVDRRMLELRFDLPALSLEGRVVAAATQEPVAGATVLALPPGQRFGRNDPAVAITLADGTFRLPGLARGNLRLEVRHRDFATVVRTIVVGPAPTPLSIDLPPRAAVRGSLVADDAALVRGAQLTLRSSVDELVSTVVQDDGSFAFPQTVTPGWAALSVADGRFAFASAASVQQVRIEENDSPFEFEVGPPAVVTGRVVDATGAPIAAARVTASQVELLMQRLTRAGNALLDRNLSKFGDQLTRSAGGEPEPLLAVTAADGRFRIAGLAPGAVDLRIVRDGYGSQKVSVEVPRCGELSSGHDVTLPRGCRISGRVQRGGRPLPGAQVGVVVDGLAITAVSALDGRYELLDLPPGTYKVRARYSTFPTVFGVEAAAVTPEQPSTVDLEFPPGRTVRGTVRGIDNQPVEGAVVYVRGQQGDPVYADSNGAFELEAPRRDVELQIGLGVRSALQIVSVPLDVGEVTVSIDAPPNCTITGHVSFLPGKKSVTGVLLRIERSNGDSAEVESRWLELHSGQLRYPLFPAGRSRVTFWCEGHAPVSRDVDLAPGEEYSFNELLLEPGCELSGVVVDDGDRPIAGAEVFLGEEPDLLVFQSQNKTDEAGRFTVRGVSTTSATLVVRAPGYAWRAVPLQLPGDVLGGKPFVVRAERGSTIQVRVAAADAVGAMLLLRRDGRVLATAEVDEDGQALFDNRGPGDYVVQRFGDERQQAAVRVEGSGKVIVVEL